MSLVLIDRLFTYVDETVLDGLTYATLRVLLDNFDPILGQADPVLDAEVTAFVDALLTTQPIILLHSCLVDWG